MCPMKVFKTVIKVIDGVEREFVMIDIDDYNDYMSLTNTNFIKLQTMEEREEEEEKKRIEEIEQNQEAERRKDQQKEDEYNKKIAKEIMTNRHENERIKKIKEDLKNDYKQVFDSNENAAIKKCGFCENYRVYPLHFLDDNNKKYKREYIENKQRMQSFCCVDCYLDAEEKKKTRITECTMHCNVCKSSYIAFGDNAIIKHNNSIKHKKNQQAAKAKTTETTKIRLELLSVKELQSICSKSLNEKGAYLINNYSKTKKDDLIKKMNEVYDKLTLDFY